MRDPIETLHWLHYENNCRRDISEILHYISFLLVLGFTMRIILYLIKKLQLNFISVTLDGGLSFVAECFLEEKYKF